MNRYAGGGDILLDWRAWTAKFTLRRALFREQIAEMSSNRTRAIKRAAAAEVIAQEAKAARLKALLEAAREQASVQSIESAERRFAEAKGEWEAAQNPLPHDDDGLGRDLPAAAPADTKGAGLQIAVRSTMIAGLILAGAYISLDPDARDDGLLESGAGTTTVSTLAPQDVIVDIDPLVSVNWLSAPVAEEAATAEGTVPDASPVGDSGRAEAVNARENDAELAARPVKISASARMRTAPALVPRPARNPFYVFPDPPAAPVSPPLLGEFE